EGPLPHCAQVRAVEHERERTLACVLRERASPVAYRPCGTEHGGAGPCLPQLPSQTASGVPAPFGKAPPAPAAPEPTPAGAANRRGANWAWGPPPAPLPASAAKTPAAPPAKGAAFANPAARTPAAEGAAKAPATSAPNRISLPPSVPAVPPGATSPVPA